MSDTSQENSIDRQRQNVAPFAAQKGYAVSDDTTYIDEGIAGDEFEKRAGFQRLLRDAAAGKFDVVLVDEVSRLSRQKYTEFMALVAHPLDKAGVTVDSVAEGPLGWEEVADLLKLTIHQTTASGESKKIARRTLTGMLGHARNGRLCGGRCPFGYKVEYRTVELPGRPPKLVPVRLVPDGFKAEIVRHVFRRYDGGATIREIVDELNGRCPAAGGGRWTKATVGRILRNLRYTGCHTWNASSDAKYFSFRRGVEVKGRRRRAANDRADWVLVEGTHEPLVEQEAFDRVQERLAGNRNGRDRSRRGGYVLSGLLQCAHCGRTLYGDCHKGTIGYTCDRTDQSGRAVCSRHRVRQDAVVRMLARVLRRTFLDPKNLAALRAEIDRQVRAGRAPANLAGLRRRIAELDAQVEQGKRNLLLIPSDMLPGMIETLRAVERERDGAAAELEQAERGGQLEDFDAAVRGAEGALWRLEDAAAQADPATLRGVLQRMVARVVIRWDGNRSAMGRAAERIVGGVIHYLPAGLSDASRLGGGAIPG
jgi:site-specific DNA recombinase